MQRLVCFLIGLSAALAGTADLRAVDSVWNYAVEVSAAVQASPAQITLSWPQDTNGTPDGYTIYRKAPADAGWGSPLASLPGSATAYTDAAVAVGAIYEYQIVKDFTKERQYSGYGYIEAAVQAPLADARGTVVLVVDQSVAGSLAAELQQLQQDLSADGWTVLRHDVGRGDSPPSVKALIRADYQADPAHVNTVFLFGHVPVAYSGLINPDGHPDHLGAWPADVYYGDMDGTWTDSTVNYTQTDNTDPNDRARLTNVPGDGKFDQSSPPATVKLKVGRVDLANLPGDLQYNADPSLPSEVELLRRYLHKDHAFRIAQLNPQRRALIGDYIGDKESIAPAASGFRSFAPIIGSAPDKLVSLNLLTNDQPGKWESTLAANDYLLALGCGAGSYSTVAGLGTGGLYDTAATPDLVSSDIRAVFVVLFGSWCGDWDSQDNIVRAVLATPTYGLASVYSGVPHWYLHPLGLGETFGTCARLTQNNTGQYQSQVNLSMGQVHLALMGDPTLTLFRVAPPTQVSASANGSQLTITWAASADSAVLGYHIYRGPGAAGPFTRLTSAPVAGLSFTDPSPVSGASYLVRAIKLETTASGSYFNASEGALVTAGNLPVVATPGAAAHLVNLSILSQAGTGSQALAAGFVIGGSGGQLPLLVRATGPALTAFNVAGVLPDPVLTIYDHTSTAIANNDNWGAAAGDINGVGSAVGAFALSDPKSTDAALLVDYAPGLFSAGVTGKGGATGKALVEVYDATPGGSFSGSPRLINLSARTQVGTGSGLLTLGFAISCSGTEKLLIRAVGPGLTSFGVSGVLGAPKLQVFDSSPAVIASNAGWGGDAAVAAAASKVGAFSLDPAAKDSALLISLGSGTYTVQVTGADGGTGVALAELYEVP